MLNKFDVNRHDAGELLHKRIPLTDQRGQATDIVYGAIRNMPAIDMVIELAASVPKERISKKLLAILRIGAYELIYAPQTAEYAIVNEAVDLAHSVAGRRRGEGLGTACNRIAGLGYVSAAGINCWFFRSPERYLAVYSGYGVVLVRPQAAPGGFNEEYR